MYILLKKNLNAALLHINSAEKLNTQMEFIKLCNSLDSERAGNILENFRQP